MLASEVSDLRRSEKKQNVFDDEVPCFASEGSPSKDAAQSDHRNPVIGFWESTEAQTWAEHTTPSTILDVEEPATLDPFAL